MTKSKLDMKAVFGNVISGLDPSEPVVVEKSPVKIKSENIIKKNPAQVPSEEENFKTEPKEKTIPLHILIPESLYRRLEDHVYQNKKIRRGISKTEICITALDLYLKSYSKIG